MLCAADTPHGIPFARKLNEDVEWLRKECFAINHVLHCAPDSVTVEVSTDLARVKLRRALQTIFDRATDRVQGCSHKSRAHEPCRVLSSSDNADCLQIVTVKGCGQRIRGCGLPMTLRGCLQAMQ